VHGRARGIAQFEAKRKAEKALVRQWLLGAPRFDERLLVEARAGHPWRERAMVPWADTVELDVATDWLYSRTDGGALDWPPANDDARFRLVNSLVPRRAVSSSDFDADTLDVGAAFGLRGFPHPPDPTRHELVEQNEAGDSLSVLRHSIHVDGCLRPLYEARLARREPIGLPLGAGVLPDHYTDVLALSLEIHLREVSRYDPRLNWKAVGSIFRDDTDRIVVLWR
jgi:hypothetical protein